MSSGEYISSRRGGKGKAARLAVRLRFIPETARLVPSRAGLAIYTYEEARGGRPSYGLLVFMGTAAKPSHHRHYRSSDARAQGLANWQKLVVERINEHITRGGGLCDP